MKLFSSLFFLAIASLLTTGCETQFILSSDPPPIHHAILPTPIRVALVLGGGGAKGIAHIGVLKALEEVGVPIDLIVGCSAGSLIGALYADYPSSDRILEMLKPLRKWDMLDLQILSCRYGLVKGHSLQRFLKLNLKARVFEELRIPLCVVVTDLLSGTILCLNSGPLIPAIHASSALPLVFSPVVYCGRLLVDGGVADPVPVDIAREIGAQCIIAVDLSGLLEKTCPSHLFGIAKRAVEINYLVHSQRCAAQADVAIRPDLGTMGLFEDSKYDATYCAGYTAAKEAIPQILQLLQNRDIPLFKTQLEIVE